MISQTLCRGPLRRGRRVGPSVAGLVLVGLTAVCRPSRPTGQPADGVQRFYAAVAAGDCAAVRAQLGSRLRGRVTSPEGCEQLRQEILEHPLERVIGTQADGRDPDAQLVRARLRGRALDVVIRVEAEDGQWKIAAL